MRIGQQVRYCDAWGMSHTATVLDIVGAGPLGLKRLDLVYTVGDSRVVVEDAPHQSDQSDGSGWWTLDAVSPSITPRVDVADRLDAAEALPIPEHLDENDA